MKMSRKQRAVFKRIAKRLPVVLSKHEQYKIMTVAEFKQHNVEWHKAHELINNKSQAAIIYDKLRNEPHAKLHVPIGRKPVNHYKQLKRIYENAETEKEAFHACEDYMEDCHILAKKREAMVSEMKNAKTQQQ